jgi:hypothetical protein
VAVVSFLRLILLLLACFRLLQPTGVCSCKIANSVSDGCPHEFHFSSCQCCNPVIIDSLNDCSNKKTENIICSAGADSSFPLSSHCRECWQQLPGIFEFSRFQIEKSEPGLGLIEYFSNKNLADLMQANGRISGKASFAGLSYPDLFILKCAIII